jgi:hypothetical protein
MAAIDLSHSDVALTIPPVDDNRFYVFPFYDLYVHIPNRMTEGVTNRRNYEPRWSNNFVNLGTVNSTLPGKYLLKFVGASERVGFESPPSNSSEYLGIINFPTVYGLIFPRVLLRSNSSTELDAVHTIQDQMELEEIPRRIGRIAPKLSPELLGNGSISPLAAKSSAAFDLSEITELLKVVARLTPHNPPAEKREAQVVQQKLKKAGLDNGHYTPPHGLNFTIVQKEMYAEMLSAMNFIQNFNNDWIDFLPRYSGNFLTQYGLRSYMAYIGYLQLVQYESLYPEYEPGFVLSKNQSYVLTFPSGKPPVINAGFWSLTVYNISSYLVQNPLNRYSLGDRSNLTYPDGDLIYGEDSSDRNDAFSILLQSADVPPPANWTSNWLPTPAGGGNFTVNCKSYNFPNLQETWFLTLLTNLFIPVRFYGPTQDLTAGGSYIYPIVAKQSSV